MNPWPSHCRRQSSGEWTILAKKLMRTDITEAKDDSWWNFLQECFVRSLAVAWFNGKPFTCCRLVWILLIIPVYQIKSAIGSNCGSRELLYQPKNLQGGTEFRILEFIESHKWVKVNVSSSPRNKPLLPRIAFGNWMKQLPVRHQKHRKHLSKFIQ